MNGWKMRGAAALAVIALSIAGCQEQPGDLDQDDLMSPDMDMTMPAATDGMDDMGASPSP